MNFHAPIFRETRHRSTELAYIQIFCTEFQQNWTVDMKIIVVIYFILFYFTAPIFTGLVTAQCGFIHIFCIEFYLNRVKTLRK